MILVSISISISSGNYNKQTKKTATTSPKKKKITHFSLLPRKNRLATPLLISDGEANVHSNFGSEMFLSFYNTLASVFLSQSVSLDFLFQWIFLKVTTLVILTIATCQICVPFIWYKLKQKLRNQNKSSTVKTDEMKTIWLNLRKSCANG